MEFNINNFITVPLIDAKLVGFNFFPLNIVKICLCKVSAR